MPNENIYVLWSTKSYENQSKTKEKIMIETIVSVFSNNYRMVLGMSVGGSISAENLIKIKAKRDTQLNESCVNKLQSKVSERRLTVNGCRFTNLSLLSQQLAKQYSKYNSYEVVYIPNNVKDQKEN